MGWVKKEMQGFWFNIPISSDLISDALRALNDKNYESIPMSHGWLYKDGDSLYMIPGRIINLINDEIWFGVRAGGKELVHCINPKRNRYIEFDTEDIFVLNYLAMGLPAFYVLEEKQDRDTSRTSHEDLRIRLMNSREIYDYCIGWTNVLNDFPNENLDDIIYIAKGLEQSVDKSGLTKDVLMRHFRDQAKIMEEYMALPSCLKTKDIYL